MQATPRYPAIRVSLRTRNSLALVAAIRLSFRQAGVSSEEIERFTREALTPDQATDRVRVCNEWARVDT